jgi:hypothetical protein
MRLRFCATVGRGRWSSAEMRRRRAAREEIVKPHKRPLAEVGEETLAGGLSKYHRRPHLQLFHRAVALP